MKNHRKTNLYPDTSGKSQSITTVLCIMLFSPLLFLGEGLGVRCSANNLTLGSTITIVDASKISFTVKWDNSWYVSTMPNNWDAVWLFVKYKDCSTTNWQHASLSNTLTDHTVAGGSGLLSVELPVTGDAFGGVNGVFIRRTAAGTGNITNAETVTLKLNGIATGNYNFKVFGIETVKVLQEDFQVGDGTSTNTFSSITITSEAALTAATLGGTGTVDLPAAYPKGRNAFYTMKYEITNEQYNDFLNCLNYDQQASRTVISPGSMANNMVIGGPRGYGGSADNGGNGIRISVSGYANTTPAVYACDANALNTPMGYLSWADLTAYLDWACLRPMTDLEFEKICRGPLGRVGGEYPWGNTTITVATDYTNFGAANETANITGMGLCASSNGNDGNDIRYKRRVGFAATATTDRVYSGAAYYGALDMAGNVWERVVATNAAGSVFTGTLGDGTLDASGQANVTNWPSGTTASGSGFRGNGFYNHTWGDLGNYLNRPLCRTSDRYGATITSTTRFYQCGGRGVR